MHQVEYYQHLVSALGLFDRVPVPGQPRIAVSDELRAIGVSELQGARVGRHAAARRPRAGRRVRRREAMAAGSRSPSSRARSPSDGIQSVMVGGRADLPVAREIEAALGMPAAPRRRPSTSSSI